MAKTYADWNTFSDADRAEDDETNATRLYLEQQKERRCPLWDTFAAVVIVAFFIIPLVMALLGSAPVICPDPY